MSPLFLNPLRHNVQRHCYFPLCDKYDFGWLLRTQSRNIQEIVGEIYPNHPNRLVYSAFRARYDVDLTRERLHRFAFLAMLGDLGGCSLSDIIGIRNTDLAKLSDEQRRKYAAMQERYRIKPQMSDADKAILAKFKERLKG